MVTMEDARGTVIVVDDDVGVLKRLERLLRFEGYADVALCERADDAWSVLESSRPVAMVLDLMMPGVDGYAMLERMHAERPDVPVIVATAIDDLDAVVRCMKAGAFDYVPKSAESARLVASLEHAAMIGRLLDDNKALRDTLLSGDGRDIRFFEAIVTRDRKMTDIFRYIAAIARSDKPILITGESGTGKELFAAAAHAASGRSGELVTVNIAGLDDAMFSDTLFGHKRGAFTGAEADRPGLIERAKGGTLFLDEIGDLPQQSQVKLLRLIEQRRYYPLGADLTRSSDALIVAATNKDLGKACAAGTFRQDLYFRLETHLVRLPPLRDRQGDLPLLVELFVARAAERFGKPAPAVPPELYELLGAYDFPGNVRELESMVHDAVGRAQGRTLSLDSFKSRVFKPDSRSAASLPFASGLFKSLPSLPTLREAADSLIEEALARSGGNQGVAAGLLGLSRTALNRRLKLRDEEDA
ncbi:MAG: sigma-54 dependent transcriptional regulator [Spirochaetes bacterium]|nr:sigma-54 dependent transcriptional regulator [Spirochaetota bacterium]MBU1079701.1 sigma-54 dependent transcriptional regulator [Spirochaetota bacterium]